MGRIAFIIAVFLLFAGLAPQAVRADEGGPGGKPAAYADWTKDATSQTGLFTLWRKDGKVYIELSPSQLGVDYIQSAVPQNGLGGFGVTPGTPYIAPARLIRFTSTDDKVVITWPNTMFSAPNGSPAQKAIQLTTAQSVVAVTPVVARDKTTGDIIIDGAPFLGDVLGLQQALKASLHTTPDSQYRLDPDRTFFGPTKAFPQNVLIEADQTWSTDNPNVVDNVPDPRSVEFRVDYNITLPPDNSDYMPRLADPRVGYFDSAYLNFGSDTQRSRDLYYIIRWNMQPTDPSKPLSPAKHPMIFYLSDTIPDQYRAPIRDALLQWNKAFARIGISDAVQVRDQPNDPNWDADDIRYNVVRWLTESNGGGFAEAELMYDPRTGQEFHTGIVIDADLVAFGGFNEWRYFIDPARRRASGSFGADERLYGMGAKAQALFGLTALRALNPTLYAPGSPAEKKYTYDFVKSIVLHESGHDMGLQHNFISSQAYSAKQQQSAAFTAQNGLSTTVMAYNPVNIWPHGMGHGEYSQIVIGPLDYFNIKWGYARVPGARSPQDELPVLRRWASIWSDPTYRFASDEDAADFNPHAVDPRVDHFQLTNDNLGWCKTQFDMVRGLERSVDHRWPVAGESYEQERFALQTLIFHPFSCYGIAEGYIGGEYLSRARAGDPRSSLPLTPVSRDEERRAFGLLDEYLFSDRAFAFSQRALRESTYDEYAPFNGAAWAYNPTPRHDLPISEIAAGLQGLVLATVFDPLRLERLDDMPMKARPGETMSLLDLFDWTQVSIYGDLRGASTASIPVIKRNLQRQYAHMLASMLLTPAPGTPYDAQSLARTELKDLDGKIGSALGSRSLDTLTRSHLEAMQVDARRALGARTEIPAAMPPAGM